jgi:endonuclease/exonuclease/phosphatase family metal-dependent hydrolase
MTRAKNNRKIGTWKRWTLRINFLFILLLFLTYITPFIPVESWGWLSLLALTYPFILIANGLFVVIWGLKGSWFSLFSLLALTIGYGFHSRYVKLVPWTSQQRACDETIELLSYNVRGLSLASSGNAMSASEKIDAIYDAMTSAEIIPDIICIQEGVKGEDIARRFGLEHYYHAPRSTLWMLSRFPIAASGMLDGMENNPSCLWADVKTPSGLLRVYNMHLASNRVTNTTEELTREMNLQNENTWSNIRFIVSRYKDTTKKRAVEATALQSHLQACPHPAIIMGDGNDPPMSRTDQILSRDLSDGFKERGFGVSTTYESTLPLLRIDYILAQSGVQFRSHRTHRLPFSDHYPVSAGICLTQEGS